MIRVTARSWISGCSESTSGTVVQLGVAMIPRCWRRSCGFTSGTTSGTPSCWRNAEESSKATAPCCAATGQSSWDAAVDVEMKATSAPAEGIVRSLADNLRFAAEREPAASRTLGREQQRSSPTGKSRSSMHRRNSAPTTPVAPTSATVSSRPTVQAPSALAAAGIRSNRVDLNRRANPSSRSSPITRRSSSGAARTARRISGMNEARLIES